MTMVNILTVTEDAVFRGGVRGGQPQRLKPHFSLRLGAARVNSCPSRFCRLRVSRGASSLYSAGFGLLGELRPLFRAYVGNARQDGDYASENNERKREGEFCQVCEYFHIEENGAARRL